MCGGIDFTVVEAQSARVMPAGRTRELRPRKGESYQGQRSHQYIHPKPTVADQRDGELNASVYFGANEYNKSIDQQLEEKGGNPYVDTMWDAMQSEAFDSLGALHTVGIFWRVKLAKQPDEDEDEYDDEVEVNASATTVSAMLNKLQWF